MTIIRNIIAVLTLTVVLGVSVQADEVVLNPDHPDRYVVVKGDTLWDISAHFLRDPWKWVNVWQINPQIENPNLIYPGDTISLVFQNGKPVLQLERAAAYSLSSPFPPSTQEPGLQAVKLSPEVRTSTLEHPIPTIPIDAVEKFLLKGMVISSQDLRDSGYVVAIEDDHLVASSGNKIYVRGLKPINGGGVEVFRMGRTYNDPDAHHKVLGYEALQVADGQLDALGDPSTVTLNNSSQEALVGDRVLFVPETSAVSYNFLPTTPENKVEGKIISFFDAVSRVGQYQAVVLNRGRQQGLRPGNVLAIYRAGEKVEDIVDHRISGTVKLPDVKSGVLMVFRAFDKASYALVMSASADIHLYDIVRNP